MRVLKCLKWLSLSLIVFMIVLPLVLFALLRSQSGSCWLIEQAQRTMSEQLEIGVCEGNWLSQIKLSNIHYYDALSDIRIQSVLLDWQPGKLWHKQLDIHRLLANDVRYQVLATAEKKDTASAFALTDLLLPVDLNLHRLEVNGLEWVTDGDNQYIQQLALSAFSQGDQIQIKNLHYVTDHLQARLQAQWQLQSAQTFSSELSWQMDVSGQGQFAGEGTITGSLTRLKLNHALNQPFKLTTAGTLDLSGDEPNFDITGNWTDARWPLKQAAEVSSDHGQYQITGTSNNYHLAVNAAVQSADILPLHLDLVGDGNTEQIHLQYLDITAWNGVSRLQGEVAWAPELSFDLALKTDPLQLQTLSPQWTGVLAAQLNIKGQQHDETLVAVVDIEQIAGRIRDYPVAVSGQVKINDQHIEAEQLILTSGSNRVQVSGFVNQELGLNVDIHAPDLAAFWPGLQGRIMGQATVSGTQEKPALVLQLTAEAVRFQEYVLAKLEADVHLDTHDKGHLEAKIEATDLQVAGESIQSLSLNSSGEFARHQLSATINSHSGQLETRLTGAYQKGDWLGELQTLNISESHAGRWQLQQAAKIQILDVETKPAIHLSDLCLQQNAAQLCAQGSRSVEGIIEAQGHLKALPLSLAQTYLPENLAIDGLINAHFNLTQMGEQLTAQVQVLPQPGVITLHTEDDEKPLQFHYKDTEIHAHLADGITELSYQIHFPQAGNSSGQMRLDAQQVIHSKLQVLLPDLAPFSVFVPDVRGLKGDLSANIDLSGTLEKPLMDVNARLHAALQVPDAGLALERIELTARNESPDRIRLLGEAHSGDGDIKLDGSLLLQPESGWPLQLSLVGENFQAVNLPEADVQVSPNLNIRIDQKGTAITGTLLIPEAHIEIQSVPESAMAVSEDEVILDDSGINSEQRVRVTTAIQTQVRLKLGQEVHFKGFGLATRLQGDLHIYSEGGKTGAQGSIKLKEGKYTAYGQDLTLERGQFAFSGPVDNPELDIRAIRTAQSSNVIAVLQVSGPVKAPQSHVFSEPALPQTEALSYLLTGNPLRGGSSGSKEAMLAKAALGYGLKQAKGFTQSLGIDEIEMEGDGTLDNSSVILGKYLTPDLYVGYVASLFGNNTGVVLKYRINDDFSMETWAGTSQSVDVLYNYETD